MKFTLSMGVWSRFYLFSNFLIADCFGFYFDVRGFEGRRGSSEVLAEDNAGKQGVVAGSVLNDLSFLRKISVDLIGRIPSDKEINRYLKWPVAERRERIVDELMKNGRFADRWTAFYADMLRIRTGATSGGALLAYVHKAIEEDKPFDELARELISANGRANSTPTVGFILNDNA